MREPESQNEACSILGSTLGSSVFMGASMFWKLSLWSLAKKSILVAPKLGYGNYDKTCRILTIKAF